MLATSWAPRLHAYCGPVKAKSICRHNIPGHPFTLQIVNKCRRFEDWNAKETEFLNETQLITSKPVVYLLNLSEKNYVAKKGKWLKPVFEWVQVRLCRAPSSHRHGCCIVYTDGSQTVSAPDARVTKADLDCLSWCSS